MLLTERAFIEQRRRRPEGHRRRPAAGPDLQRERPAGGRVPAQRHLGRPGAGRIGGGVVRRALRIARRRAGHATGRRRPTGQAAPALNQTRRLWTELRADEQRHRITPEPRTRRRIRRRHLPVGHHRRPGLGAGRLDAAGTGSPLSAGDFVRWCRQVLDLLDQVRNAAPTPALRTAAKRAINDIRRGVVAVDAG